MPLYVYSCPKCKVLSQELRSIDSRTPGPRCKCGRAMDLVIQPVAGVVKDPAVPRRK